jgi:hypothetical protein
MMAMNAGMAASSPREKRLRSAKTSMATTHQSFSRTARTKQEMNSKDAFRTVFMLRKTASMIAKTPRNL